MFPTVEDTWTGAAGENMSRGVCYLDSYLYTILMLDPAQCIKINPATMATVDKWTGDANEKYPGRRGIATDGTYIYVAVTSSALPWSVVGDVVKINPTTMTKIDKWSGADLSEAHPMDLVYEAPYLYLVLSPSSGTYPVKVVRIDPVTMATVDSWSGDRPSGETEGEAITILDGFFYVSCGSVPALVVKVNKTTMTTDSRWEGDMLDGGNIEGIVYGVTNDGTSVYAGTFEYSMTPLPTRLIKIDPATMTTVSKYQGAADEFLSYGLIHYNAQVYMGLYGYPHSMVLRIDTATMTEVDRWEDVGEDDAILGFCLSNPQYLFAGLNDSPADVLKFEIPEIPGPPAKGGSSTLLLFAKMLMG